MVRDMIALALAFALLLIPQAGCTASRSGRSAGGDAAVLKALPALAKLPPAPAMSARKDASDAEYELLLSPPVLKSGGSSATYTSSPRQISLVPLDGRTMAYSVFGLGGLPTDGSVIPLKLKLTGSGNYWLAVSDYAHGSWQYLDYVGTGDYTLSSGAGLISPTGSFYAALIAWQTPASMSSVLATLSGQAPGGPHELWYFTMANLLVDQNLTDAIALLNRAAAAGYTKVVHADYKFGAIDMQSQHYYDNLEIYKDAAAAAGIEIIPGLVPIGYSNSILNHDPNLIEGQGVVDCHFRASAATADVVQDPATTIVNGDFENHSGDSFPGWNQMDGAGMSTFADTAVFHGGSASMRFENYTAGNPTGNDRIRQQITVAPWNCYAVSIWLKTDAVSPSDSLWFRIFSGDFSRMLTFLTYPIQSTQDWTQYYLIFNSQDETQVHLYIGLWGGQSGQFWIDDVSIENTGLINLIRRSGAPFTVKSGDGSTTYSEGSDYEPVEDPLMGRQGTWNMDYDLYHARPVITLTPGSAIKDGDDLRVSYYHAVFVYDMQPTCCLTDEGVYDVIRTTLTQINTRLAPKAVFIGIDETRVINWCEGCQSRGLTAGGLLAYAAGRIEQIAHEVNPQWKLITWSDMFDPNHNAHDDYFLARGTVAGSWDGLPAAWDIGNWNSGASRSETLSFFSARTNRQILCGYYDEPGPTYSIGDWLTDAKPYVGVYAVMYTTWQPDYTALEAWGQAVRDWEAANP